MYVVALIFLLGAVGALAIGFFQSGLTLILVSIAASLISAFFLLVGMLRTKTVQRATAGAPYEPPAREPERVAPAREEVSVLAPPQEPGMVREVPVSRPQVGVPSRRPSAAVRAKEELLEPSVPGAPEAATRRPAGRKKPARKVAKGPAKKPAAKRAPSLPKALSPTSRVTVTGQGKYHRASCRFVKGKRGLETMPRSGAEDAGYVPCGVCKPA